jgi:hypothetical protein
VDFLIDEIREHGASKEVVDHIVKVAKRYGIVTPYTSALMTEDTPTAQVLQQLQASQTAKFGGQEQNQSLQDGNSLQNGGASKGAQWAMAKCWSSYNCAGWDLVDAAKAKDFKLQDVKKEDLPKEMQELSLEARSALVAKMGQEREALQKEINQLGVERQKFIDAEIKSKNRRRTAPSTRRSAARSGTRPDAWASRSKSSPEVIPGARRPPPRSRCFQAGRSPATGGIPCGGSGLGTISA